MSVPLNDKRIINAWCMYDWANSAYSLVITTALFPIFYQSATAEFFGSDIVMFFGREVINTVLYSYSLSSSFLITALLLPVLSGIADYTGNKKFFMKIFVYVGSFACICLYFFFFFFFELGIIFIMMASIGFSGFFIFYDAFLPEITTADQMDRVSARGYSMGYIGSVILLIANLVMITFWQELGFDSITGASQTSFLMVGLWWFGFSQIPFRVLPDNIRENPQERGNYLTKGYQELFKVAKTLISKKEMKIFLAAFFFFNMGVQTIILLSTIFADKVLNMERPSLIATILIIQLVAVGGAYLFSKVSGKFGNKNALLIMIVIWCLSSLGAYFVQNQYQFYLMAFFVGLVLGGIQSLSRATFSKMIPEGSLDHASYFSFYDVTYYISIVMGTFTYGLVEQLTSNIRQNAILLAIYFVIAFVILSFLRFDFKARSERPLLQPGK